MTTHKHLEIALQIAVNAHFGQVDKAGKPYIFHPLRVMNSVDSVDEKIVAILHDVVEDTPITFKNLSDSGIPMEIINVLSLLTHNKSTDYMDYIACLSTNEIARTVKLADLNDNRDLSRLLNVTDKDLERVKKYKLAYEYLKSYHIPAL